MPSYTIQTLVSFNGANGESPYDSLIADSAGDLFGTTYYGGANGYGTVFEIQNTGTVANPVYAATPTTLVSFNNTNGANPHGSLIADSAGDLFGTTVRGGPNANGTVFEIQNTGTVANPVYAATPTTLVLFNNTNGANPNGSLIADSAGDLFGTTSQGGADGRGTVFEIQNTGTVANPAYAATPTTLVSFNNANGAFSAGSLIADSAGDLFGTTSEGGANGNDGTVFEIKNTGTVANPVYAATPTTIVSFDNTNGATPEGSLIADSAGDLFGTTEQGGANPYGTVFEIKNTGTVANPVYAANPTTLVSFNNANGAYPVRSLIADSAGDLFGTTPQGGADGRGTVFEIQNTGTTANPVYAANPTTIVSFDNTNGATPEGSLIADSAGHLYATTSSGGANGQGTVFELSLAPTVVAESATALAGAQATGSGGTAGTGALAGDSDPSGGMLSITSITGSGITQTVAAASTSSSSATIVAGTYGTLTVGADGSYTYVASNGLAIITAANGSAIVDTFSDVVSSSAGPTASSSIAVTVSLASGGTETVVNPTGAATYSIGATTLTLNETSNTVFSGVIQDGSSGNTGGQVVVSGGATLSLGGASTYTGGTTITAGTLHLDAATTGSFGAITAGAAGRGGVAFGSGGAAQTLQVETVALSGDHSLAYAITGFAIGGADVIDVRGVGTDQVSYSSSAGTLTLTSGGATQAILHVGASYSGDVFTATADGAGGTQVTAMALTQAVVRPTMLTVNEGSGAHTGNALSGDTSSNIAGSHLTVTMVDGTALDVGQSVAGTYGTLTLQANGTYNYTPTVTNLPAGQNPTDTFNYTVQDLGTGNTTTVPFTVTVDGVSAAAPPPPPAPATDVATPGSDLLTANAGGDTILAQSGDDTIYGGTGHDVLYGNAGNDIVYLYSQTDASTVYGGMGNDTIDASGSSHANFLSGDFGDDSIHAGSGADTLYGGDGNDTLIAGTGQDQIYGNAGNDRVIVGSGGLGATVYGGMGNDTLDASASTHANFLSGDLGNDTIRLGSGADTAYGGDGADTIVAGTGHDQIYGNAGNDLITVSGLNLGSTIYGGAGDDRIDASASTHGNYISGDLGNDVILAGTGGDTIHGGAGSDTIQAASNALTFIHAGLSDSSAVSAADQSQLDHVLGFNSTTRLVFDGDPAATSANTISHGGDASIANYAAAYAYAYGDGAHAAALSGAVEYAVVSDTAGHVYVFAQDHAAIQLDGLAGGVASVTAGQILAA